jgi:hypothetical protein
MVLNIVIALCLALIANALVVLVVWDHVNQPDDEEENEHFHS